PRTSSTGCPLTSAGWPRHMCGRTGWWKQGVVSSRRAISLGGAVAIGMRLNAFVSKGGFLRTLKSMMRRSLNGASSKRLRSPASVANADLPCAQQTVLPGFSLPKARANVHRHCCDTNWNTSPASQTAAIARMQKRYFAPSREVFKADSVSICPWQYELKAMVEVVFYVSCSGCRGLVNP